MFVDYAVKLDSLKMVYGCLWMSMGSSEAAVHVVKAGSLEPAKKNEHQAFPQGVHST